MAAALKQVPWLVALDMCRRFESGPFDTHSLAGWVDLLDPCELHGLYRAVRTQCLKRDGNHNYLWQSSDKHTNAENARLWNRAMRSLGYYKTNGTMVI